MNALLQHYDSNGSATPEWLRMARQVEAAEDFAPLGAGPLEPEAAPAPARAVYTREDFASFVDQDRAERRAMERADRELPL